MAASLSDKITALRTHAICDTIADIAAATSTGGAAGAIVSASVRSVWTSAGAANSADVPAGAAARATGRTNTTTPVGTSRCDSCATATVHVQAGVAVTAGATASTGTADNASVCASAAAADRPPLLPHPVPPQPPACAAALTDPHTPIRGGACFCCSFTSDCQSARRSAVTQDRQSAARPPPWWVGRAS